MSTVAQPYIRTGFQLGRDCAISPNSGRADKNAPEIQNLAPVIPPVLNPTKIEKMRTFVFGRYDPLRA